jgi:glutamate/tyrosine decarboxylase-like PLP-dependent enzyme
VFVPVDGSFRMDTGALWDRLRDCAARRVPVLACVSVCGTTEESAVDRLNEVAEVRRGAMRELGLAFHLHSDACYGGYAAAVTWRADGTRRTTAEIREATGTSWPGEGWVDAMAALAETDSVTIDPHKLGYIPYPAGAFLLRDRRARELVSVDPPYLAPADAARADEELYLGRHIFEGSKPGAAAAAVWLSHKVLPLDERGYGHLIERTAAGALRLRDALVRAEIPGCRVHVLPEPDINIVCYVVRPDGASGLAQINALNEAIYRRMSLNAATPAPEYIITRTRFQSPMYEGAADGLLAELGVPVDEWRAAGAEGLVVLRSTVMDPFLAAEGEGADHVAGYVGALARAAGSSRAEGEGPA